MPNSFAEGIPEYWSRRMQVFREDKSVYKAVANMEERSGMKRGDKVHRPYMNTPYVTDYAKNTDVSFQDVDDTDESLTIDQFKTAPFYIDDVDELQSNYKLMNLLADRVARQLESYIDGQFLAEVANATNTVDDSDISGGSGTITTSPSNITRVFSAAQKYLNQENIDQSGRYAVIGPTGLQHLLEKLDGKDSALGDSTGKNGNVGKYMGFDIYVSNNIYYTATWTPANDPSDGDTITINGVTFTFKTSPTTAGQVDIGGSVADTLDNLVAAINGTGTPGSSTYIDLSDSDREKLQGCVATDGTTKLDIAFSGGGEVTVAASEANDPWSAQTAYWMFGHKGTSVDMVVQHQPEVTMKDNPNRRGQNVIPLAVYGIKTFTEGADAMVQAKIDASDY